MKPAGSLWARLMIGAVLWTLVLTLSVHVGTIVMVQHFRDKMWMLHFLLLGVVALGLIVAAAALVRAGLSPLHALRVRLGELRRGERQRIEGEFPAEVQPLLEDLNALLEEREQRVRRAQAKAGDLAHGLKTPLALLAREAEQLRASGAPAAAEAIDEQVARMRSQIDYHLAQARAAVSGASLDARCAVRESCEALVRTMERLHAERALTFALEAPADLHVRVQRADLDEMLGNLLDNACRAARTRIAIAARAENGTVLVTIDDDGPGLAPELREQVLRRGVRADEATPGSGLGLAIVRDLAELYGGAITLESSPAGGLRAVLRLPA